ncbi:MAG TPA: hypothetical protein VG935_01375, partial [Patescibacteria group bacterium]|nr:hypothetical protein [Patescibacteria group bacterium]
TRSQKINSDLRHHALPPQASFSPSVSLSDIRPQSTLSASPIKPVIATLEYQFVRHDLLKTISITAAIIIAELILSFWMK